ncbi:MAG: hypothetical protein HY898_26790 [Deltaproteobacteria bacterium]|nr:hypothetical protein [Deltaproteobacteria bacterium]
MLTRFRWMPAACLATALALSSCGGDSSEQDPAPSPETDGAAGASGGPDGGKDATISDSQGPDAADVTWPDSADAMLDAKWDAKDGSKDGPAPLDAGPCNPDPQTGSDGPRTVLVTHPFATESNQCGRRVRLLRLDVDGQLTDTGASLDVGDCPERVRFAPDGRLALVINNNSHDPQAGTQSVVALRNDAAGKVVMAAELKQLAGANPVDIAFSPDGKKAYVADYNIEGQGGVHVLDVTPGCTASYVKKIPVTTPKATQVLPGDSFAVVLGGKSPIDTVVIDLAKGSVVKEYDLFSDFVDSQTLSLSPDGKVLIVPNSSPFSSLADTVSTVAIDSSGAAPVPSLQATLSGVTEPTGVAFSPDGLRVVVSNFSGDKVSWLKLAAQGTLSVEGSIASVPLAGFLTMLQRGPNAGLVLVTSVTSVRMLRLTDTGMEDKGALSIGAGAEAITGDIAIEP